MEGIHHQYREDIRRLILGRAGNVAADLAVDANPEWSMTDEVPPSLSETLKEGPWTISLLLWMQLTDLQRFTLRTKFPKGHGGVWSDGSGQIGTRTMSKYRTR